MTDDTFCPLCREEVSTLQFHHWDYDNDTGVDVCPGCHYWVHGGDRATEQEKETKDVVARGWERKTAGWRHNAVHRVILADLATINDDHVARESVNEYVDYVLDRYNIPTPTLLPEWILNHLIDGTVPDTLGQQFRDHLTECKQNAREDGWWST